MVIVNHWTIELIGHQFDLEDLPLWTTGANAPIVRNGDVFSIQVPASLVGSQPEPVRPYALAAIERLNGVGRLLNPSFRPLTLATKTLGIDAQGNVISTSIEVGGAELRLKAGLLAGSINGVPQRDPREGVALPLLNAAETSGRAHDALVILGRPSLTWAEIYLVFELVEGDVGSMMYEYGWISKPEADLLGRTANSYSTLRSSGRHGKDRGNPPRSPMAHSTALGLMRRLVVEWLRHISKQGKSRE
jgi:hypothetical protein